VPTTGSAAAYPGKTVVPSKTREATTTAARPPQDSSACTDGLSRISRVLRQAARAPRPSSQARVKGEKYAATGSVVL
jgi:hypothetical protein